MMDWVGLGPFAVGLGWVWSKNMEPCPSLACLDDLTGRWAVLAMRTVAQPAAVAPSTTKMTKTTMGSACRTVSTRRESTLVH